MTRDPLPGGEPCLAHRLPDGSPGAPRHPALSPFPSKLFVEVTTRCNLHCAMCVKGAPGQGIAEGDMSGATFARLTPTFSRLDALILNGVGEPLLHDYPFCYDCTVALCDYQQGEDFTQDCYMCTVPCGACLWSTGVFQCLR